MSFFLLFLFWCGVSVWFPGKSGEDKGFFLGGEVLADEKVACRLSRGTPLYGFWFLGWGNCSHPLENDQLLDLDV